MSCVFSCVLFWIVYSRKHVKRRGSRQISIRTTIFFFLKSMLMITRCWPLRRRCLSPPLQWRSSKVGSAMKPPCACFSSLLARKSISTKSWHAFMELGRSSVMPLDARKVQHIVQVVTRSFASRQRTVVIVYLASGSYTYIAVQGIMRFIQVVDPQIVDASGQALPHNADTVLIAPLGTSFAGAIFVADTTSPTAS